MILSFSISIKGHLCSVNIIRKISKSAMNSSSDPIEIKNQTPNGTEKPQKTTRRPSSVKFERSQYILALEELSRYDKHHPFPDSTIWERLLFHTPPKISGRYAESVILQILTLHVYIIVKTRMIYFYLPIS
jgi:hypothetical protein